MRSLKRIAWLMKVKSDTSLPCEICIASFIAVISATIDLIEIRNA